MACALLTLNFIKGINFEWGKKLGSSPINDLLAEQQSETE